MSLKNKKKKNRIVRLALIQSRSEGSRKANLDKTLRSIEAAAQKKAHIICLQELFLSDYFPQTQDVAYFSLAEKLFSNNKTLTTLSAAAQRAKAVVIASLFEKRAAGIYHNTVVVFDADGKLLGKYRKMHIPEDPQFCEKFYFTPGDTGYGVFKTRYGTIGVLVCWDQWYPEAARLTAMKGAEILFYPTAIGWLPEEKSELGEQQHAAWETIQRSHAVANGCFVASVNRVGFEKNPSNPKTGIEFWGQSFVAGTYGQILKKASPLKEEILLVDVDLKEVNNTRIIWPFFRDRRVDSYSEILNKFSD